MTERISAGRWLIDALTKPDIFVKSSSNPANRCQSWRLSIWSIVQYSNLAYDRYLIE